MTGVTKNGMFDVKHSPSLENISAHYFRFVRTCAMADKTMYSFHLETYQKSTAWLLLVQSENVVGDHELHSKIMTIVSEKKLFHGKNPVC